MTDNNDFVEITYKKSKHHSWMVPTTKFDHPTGNFEMTLVDSEFTRGAKSWENQVRWVKDRDGTVRPVIHSREIEFMIFDNRLWSKMKQWVLGRDRGFLRIYWGDTWVEKTWRWIFEIPSVVHRFFTQKRDWWDPSLGSMRGVVVTPASFRTILSMFQAGKLTSRRELEKVLEGMDVLFRY
jgi:hypothetical protein